MANLDIFVSDAPLAQWTEQCSSKALMWVRFLQGAQYMEIFIQIVGWIGAFLIVLAYFLVSYTSVQSSSRVYQLMNLVGAIGIGINTFYQEAWPSFSIQIVWGIIAIIALVKSVRWIRSA